MELVLATKNINKIRRLKKIFSKNFPNIFLTDVSDLNIKSPQENGLKQEDNLKIKLNYYHKILEKDIISEDDVLELKVKGKYILILKVNDFFKNGNNLYEDWINYLRKNNIITGRLIKNYGIVINNQIKISKVVVPLIVKTKGICKKNIESNLLNNFVGPMEKGLTFNEMSKNERDKYMNNLCEPLIRQLIKYK
ncbi:MAG: non-canonical purine NTP pyrophosphatase [Candidatus Shapirobacteria bacterium]|nr:non-canonical purine NTP pyrophosphatase [Candidatus Shapirobacteria bacterium]